MYNFFGFIPDESYTTGQAYGTRAAAVKWQNSDLYSGKAQNFIQFKD